MNSKSMSERGREVSQGEQDYWALKYAHEQEYHAERMRLLVWESETKMKLMADGIIRPS